MPNVMRVEDIYSSIYRVWNIAKIVISTPAQNSNKLLKFRFNPPSLKREEVLPRSKISCKEFVWKHFNFVETRSVLTLIRIRTRTSEDVMYRR
jgi:hypothetical protein